MAQEPREAVQLAAMLQPDASEGVAEGVCREPHVVETDLIADAVERLVDAARRRRRAATAQEDMRLFGPGAH